MMLREESLYDLSFLARSADRTLTDDEVNQVHARIVQKIVHATGASIR